MLLPRQLDHFGSVMLSAGPDHIVFALLATIWLLEFVSTWLASFTHRGILWNLPQRIFAGLEELTPRQVAEGCSDRGRVQIEALLALHNAIE